jgi:hypothetical protein
MAAVDPTQRVQFLRINDEELTRIKQRINQYTSMGKRAHELVAAVPHDEIWLGPLADHFRVRMQHIATLVDRVEDELEVMKKILLQRRAELEKG